MSLQRLHQQHHIASPQPMPPRPPSAPPPYSYPPSPPNGPGAHTDSHRLTAPFHLAAAIHPRLPGSSKSPRRPLPPLPETTRVDTDHLAPDEPRASGSRLSLRFSSSSSSLSRKPSSSSPPPPSSPPLSTSPTSPIPSGSSSRSPSTRASKHRSFAPFLSLLRPSRPRSKQIAEREAQTAVNDAGLRAAEEKRVAELEAAERAAAEEQARLVVATTQSNAKEEVGSNIRSLLSRQLASDGECELILKNCVQICKSGGLDLSVVLQEPLIDGKPPVYWAILNGPSTSLQDSDADFDTLVVALLGACQPLKDTTITSIRVACMLTSNNVLLQHLFRRFPALSPLTPGDAILLSSAGGGDVVDVDETQDGTGTFVARIQIRRFRLRMRVSKLIRVEFVTSDRIWTIAFSVRPENVAEGRFESQWSMSLGLADHSMPVWVDADLVISGSPPSTDDPDNHEPAFNIPICCDLCELKPGSEGAIRIRLDDGPMRPHLLNESQALVDSDGTLHAEFTARLTRPMHSSILSPSIDFTISDSASQVSSALGTITTTTTSSRSEPPRSPLSNTSALGTITTSSTSSRSEKPPRSPLFRKKRSRDGPAPVYATLRRGGR